MNTTSRSLLTLWIALSFLFSVITAEYGDVIDNFTSVIPHLNSVLGDRYGEGDCQIEKKSIKIGSNQQLVDLDFVIGLDYTKKAYEFIYGCQFVKPPVQDGLDKTKEGSQLIKPTVQHGCLHWQEAIRNLPGVRDVTDQSLVITYSAENTATNVILNLEFKRRTYTVEGYPNKYPYGRASIDFCAVDFPTGQKVKKAVPFSEFKNAGLFNAVAIGITNFGAIIQVHEIKIVNTEEMLFL